MKLIGVSFRSNFRDMGKVMPADFGEIEMSFWVRKRPASFSERQPVAARKFG